MSLSVRPRFSGVVVNKLNPNQLEIRVLTEDNATGYNGGPLRHNQIHVWGASGSISRVTGCQPAKDLSTQISRLRLPQDIEQLRTLLMGILNTSAFHSTESAKLTPVIQRAPLDQTQVEVVNDGKQYNFVFQLEDTAS